MKRAGSFWFAVPIAAILLSAALVVVPALRDYLKLHHAARGARFLTMGQFVVPNDQLLPMSMEMSAVRQQGAITMLNAPGQILYLLIAVSVGHSSHWYPASIGPALWRVFIFPFCALPAWLFLGRALDGWFAGTRLRRADLVVGVTLFTLFLTLSAGLRFGLSPEERAGQGLLFWGYIYGLVLWAGLMTIPVAAWFRQRKFVRLSQSR